MNGTFIFDSCTRNRTVVCNQTITESICMSVSSFSTTTDMGKELFVYTNNYL